jgi:hypothetical protein
VYRKHRDVVWLGEVGQSQSQPLDNFGEQFSDEDEIDRSAQLATSVALNDPDL